MVFWLKLVVSCSCRFDRFPAFAKGLRSNTLLPQCLQAQRIVPLCESLPLLIGHELAVEKRGRRTAERAEQEKLAKCARDQVRATNDFRDSHLGVVDGAGE